ncbi:MAG: general secretion pathway protein GspJ [Pseudomonadota bacterium]|nr:general secretion pathway protein GspJ [Pseudomonadota bacterium]
MTAGVRSSASRAAGRLQPARAGRTAAPAAAGFTLVEVLLATVLLAAGLALAFATLSAATVAATRGEAMAQRSETMRAVEGFIRGRLTAARPVSFELDQDTMLPSRFVGEPDRMRFVADLPDYLGRGGPYLHDFRVAQDGDEVRLLVSLDIVVAGLTVTEPQPRDPELLASGLGSAAFRYKGLDADGNLSEWRDRWTTIEQLPLMVEVTLTDADGRVWPPLVVAPRLAGGIAGGRSEF